MNGAVIIKFNDDVVKITSFNPFSPSVTTSTKSVVKINSIQTLEHQSDPDFGEVLFILSKRYELVYLDKNGIALKKQFSFLSRKDERRVLKELQKYF